jgi:RNA polymerase sigma-70 factor (ECF subfamily)
MGLMQLDATEGFLDVTGEKANSQPQTSASIVSLTRQMVNADEKAYRRFYDLYFDRLLRYLLVLTRNEDQAREALQVTLLRVVRHIKPFDSEASFWKWLARLARSSVIDESRKSSRYLKFLCRFFEQTQVTLSPDQAERQLDELVMTNLKRLPEEDQHLISQMYFEGKSVRECARETQTSEKAIESRLTRVRRKLREMTLAQLRHE